MFGELAWAASPISTARPFVQVGGQTSSIGATCSSPERAITCSSDGTGSANPENS